MDKDLALMGRQDALLKSLVLVGDVGADPWVLSHERDRKLGILRRLTSLEVMDCFTGFMGGSGEEDKTPSDTSL